MNGDMKRVALYIHLPFCARKCAYCDFVSFPGQTDRIPAYLDRLAREMRSAVGWYGPLAADTVFLGGGTPSLLSGEQMKRLMGDVGRFFEIAPDAEITVEANPGTVDAEKLAVFREAGINRLSLGVQSFDDGLLRRLGRIHTAREAEDAARMAAEAGFSNLSLDLMYALPGQNMSQWTDTLERALDLPVKHISCYSLILEDGTPMKALIEANPELLPDEEIAVGMQHEAARRLAERGFSRYEISNYALPGFESRHNLVYWRRGDYLGLGCAAHSLMNGIRFANTPSLEGYLAGEGAGEADVLSARDVYEETVMLGLRTREGVEAALLPPDRLARLCGAGLMAVDGGRARVTEAGADVLNAVILELV
ncbi:MAG: radical SAM family heme chaperone HemW [Clostridia bacterium]|nr:radical SAM family heme chaperone HemW [Clostridia bacterium]